MLRIFFSVVVGVALGCGTGRAAEARVAAAEVEVGERLFLETRFAQFFFAHAGDRMNAPLAKGDPVLARVALATKGGPVVKGPFAGQSMNCAVCHLNEELKGKRALPGRGVEAFSDFARRSPVPKREDGRTTTERNSRSLVGALEAGAGEGGGAGRGALFNFDGAFVGAEAVIKGTITGRNYGWLPGEQAAARKHFARVIREDDGTSSLAADYGKLSYAVLLRGTDETIPAALRLPEKFRVDVATVGDEAVLDAGARLIAAYLRSLQFARDARGLHNGSPYDAFLAANKLPRAPARGETTEAYTRKLREAVDALTEPKFVQERKRKLKYHEQIFQFGEAELRGLRIFLREPERATTGGAGEAKTGGAGNCAACHTPPHFTDFAFHNTGAAQDDFDALNGAGEFARLEVPRLAVRNADIDAWLPATEAHPKAKGPFLALPGLGPPPPTDLGLWNVYRHPDLPAPQAAIERLLNPDKKYGREEALTRSLARFKTTGLRDLGQTGPYLHTGRFKTLEEVLRFYQRVTELAREGKLRNAPEEFSGVRLDAADVAALAAFLRALNEDYE